MSDQAQPEQSGRATDPPKSIAGPGPCVRQMPGTTMVQEGESPYVWPTWREALLDAWEGVNAAYDRRRAVIQAAYDAGLSFRNIADAVGSSPATIHKIIGRQRSGAVLLDEPAQIGVPDQKQEPR